MKRKIAVIVGAGFSAALTTGQPAVIGHRPLPTLANLGEQLWNHVQERLGSGESTFNSFSLSVITEAMAALNAHFSRRVEKRYNFEQFISLMAFRSSLFNTSLRDAFPDVPGTNPSVLRFMLHALYDFFGSAMAYDKNPVAQRMFAYQVNDQDRAIAMKTGMQRLVDDHDVSFISFNYDGILEALIGHDFRAFPTQPPRFRYFSEISHGIPTVLPENLVRPRDLRNLGQYGSVPPVIKPHGSMHFFQVREEMRSLIGGPSMVALHPLLDIGFDPNTQSRKVPNQDAWQFTNTTPFIVPPILNKDAYLGSDYFREMLKLSYNAVASADHVVVLGFSLPTSDLHVGAVFEAVEWNNKKLAIYYAASDTDTTPENWKKVAPAAAHAVLSSTGIDCSSVAAIESFWSSFRMHIES